MSQWGRWTNDIGNSLIKEVRLYVGGHKDKRWYCQKCFHCTDQVKPEYCQNTLTTQDDEKYYIHFREVYEKEIGSCGLTDKDIDDYGNQFNLPLDETKFTITNICNGQDFKYTDDKGYLLDTYLPFPI